MRFVNGMIVGFLLAIGVAYWHDRSVTAAPDGEARQLVNWEEFGRSMSETADWVRVQVDGIADSLHRRG